jgi:hypothetical protein
MLLTIKKKKSRATDIPIKVLVVRRRNARGKKLDGERGVTQRHVAASATI